MNHQDQFMILQQYIIQNTVSIWLVVEIRLFQTTGNNIMAGIRTSDLPHSMTMSQKVPHSYPLGHRGSLV